MMKLKIHEKVLYRVPQLPTNANLAHCWEDLKQSIALSSPQFYNLIKNTAYQDFEYLPLKFKITIQKYFNRARFRATPYGTFAAFGMCNLNSRNEVSETGITISNSATHHHFMDWSAIPDQQDIHLHDLRNSDLIFTNSTYYKIDDKIRYIYRQDELFQLSEIPSEKLFIKVLERCKSPISVQELLSYLTKLPIEDEEFSKLLIAQLLQLQLLFSSNSANIIGDDYFTRIGKIGPFTPDSPTYVISERALQQGTFPKERVAALPALMDYLSRIIPEEPAPTLLTDFIKSFSKRYDLQLIPIMQALDPEIGIGYGGLEIQGQQSLAEILSHEKSEYSKGQNEPFKEKLLFLLLANQSAGRFNLELLQPDLDLFKNSGPPLANTISALITLLNNGDIKLEHTGGTAASALAGRFTLASDQILEYCHDMICTEAIANPDVLFFDIAYMGEKRVDNINRRKAIYPLQLSLLNFDLSECPLTLNDLYLCVRDGQLVLYSKHYGKRLIPRLSTAYNYSRSDLSLFRLLCDIQGQGLRTSWNIDLQEFVPELDYYPELYYKNIILSPRKWKLDLSTIEHAATQEQFKNYIRKLNLPTVVKVGTADQTLLLRTEEKEDLILLFHILQSKKKLWIQEARGWNEPLLRDEQANPYIGEFILALTHDQPIYKPYKEIISMAGKGSTRIYWPGSEWLCYEIHCHESVANSILTESIDTLLLEQSSKIEKWFFIRYNEGGNHLRLRLQLHDPEDSGTILSRLSYHLHTYLECGRIADLQIKPYHRELERYGTESIAKVEYIFYLDSQLVLSLIKESPSEAAIHQFSAEWFLQLAIAFQIENQAYRQLIAKMCSHFSEEHHIKGKGYKAINSKFRSYSNVSGRYSEAVLSWKQEILYYILQHFKSGLNNEKMLADIFHMHVNRLFPGQQRIHEFIIYEYIKKSQSRFPNSALSFSLEHP